MLKTDIGLDGFVQSFLFIIDSKQYRAIFCSFLKISGNNYKGLEVQRYIGTMVQRERIIKDSGNFINMPDLIVEAKKFCSIELPAQREIKNLRFFVTRQITQIEA